MTLGVFAISRTMSHGRSIFEEDRGGGPKKSGRNECHVLLAFAKSGQPSVQSYESPLVELHPHCTELFLRGPGKFEKSRIAFGDD
jgi:hypothetical protein